MLEALNGKTTLVYAHWHGDEWLLLGTWKSRKMAVLSSLSKEGRRMGLFMKLLGLRVFDGSSSKGGTGGLLNLVRAVKNDGYSSSLAVDGPRGPRHEVKEGVIQLAKLVNRPIIPVKADCTNAWVLKKAWSQPKIPKPFSTIEIDYGPPIYIQDKERTREFVQAQML